jgi:broad specificity phosphatase PhoE
MTAFYFVRHGQSEWNAIGRFQGQWDSDLSEIGRRQAHTTGRLLAGHDIRAIVASPLDRARQTAEIVAEYVDAPVSYDERIKEWHCGEWSGHLREDVMRRWPEAWAARLADPFHYRGPGCENYPDMFQRAAPFVEELRAREEPRIAVVSHGMIGKVIVSILLGLGEEETLAIHQPNDVVFRIDTGPSLPCVDHYRAGEGPFPGLTTSA